MGRSPSSDESGLKKGPWTPEEDHKLIQHIEKHGHGSWRALPKLAGLNRCGKSCRLRWTNYLRPDIKRGKFSPEEEQTILNLHAILGNKWSAIASNLPGRTDNEIKNYWNTHLKKKLIQMGFDPMTHRPRTDIFSSLPQLIALAKLKELMDQQPWDDHSIRLQQAEAINMAKLQCLQQFLQPTPPFPIDITSNNNMNMNNNTTITTTTLDMDPLPVVPTLDNCRQTQYSKFGEQAVHVPFNEPNQQIPSMVQRGGESTSQLHKAVSFSHEYSCVLPPLTDCSLRNINGGDACSTLSYDPCGTSSSLWSDLLVDDSFINQFD